MSLRARVRNAVCIITLVLAVALLVLDLVVIINWRYP